MSHSGSSIEVESAVHSNEQFQLVVRLDKPVDKSTTFSSLLEVKGWFLLPDAYTRDDISSVEIVLERFDEPSSFVTLGMGMRGECVLSLGSGLDLSVADIAVHEPEAGLSGRTCDFRGVYDVGHLLPAEEGATLFRMSAVVEYREFRSISNSCTFTVSAPEVLDKAQGGFLLPGSGEIHSDYLIIQGWAVKHDFVVNKVVVRVNGKECGIASIGLASPDQGSALPDFSEAGKCRFTYVLSRAEVFGSIEEQTSAIEISAHIFFSDGTELLLDGPGVYWGPDPLRDAHFLKGCITRVACNASGDLNFEGEAYYGGYARLDTELLTGGRKYLLATEHGTSFYIKWYTENGKTDRYPTLIENVPSRFTLTVPAFAFSALGNSNRPQLRLLSSSGSSLCDNEHLLLLLQDAARQAHKKHGLLMREGGKEKLRIGVEKIKEVVGSSSQKQKREPLSRVVFISHNLQATEGAPKVLQQLVSYLRKQHNRVECSVISPREGELRHGFEELGVEVIVIPELDAYLQTPERYAQGEQIALNIFQRLAPQLVYANVVDSYWSIDMSHRLGIPNIWAIHESIEPKKYFEHCAPEIQLRFLHALGYADRFLFVSESTKKLFQGWDAEAKSVVIPNSVQVTQRVGEGTSDERRQARARLNISDSTIVVSIIGTTTYRKGQDIFIREMAMLKRKYPDRDFAFLVVGARDIPFFRQLVVLTAQYGLEEHLRFVYERPDIEDYFLASDVLCICSRFESAPLVSLEAFAYGVPLVSTTVFGLEEQIRPGVNALTFAEDEHGQLAQQVGKLIDSPQLAQKITAEARRDVQQRFSPDIAMQKYWELFSETYGQNSKSEFRIP